MDRRYYRQYENFDTVVPRIEDFPILDANKSSNQVNEAKIQKVTNPMLNVKLDDIVLIGILVLLLMDEEKDVNTILGIAFLFLAEYIF